jgi:hypothetical protein
MPRENFYPFGHDEPLTDEPSEFGLPRSRDAQSTRVAGGYAATAPSTNPDRSGGRVRHRAGQLLRQ